VIGGTVAGAGNVISGNGLHGVFLTDPGTTGNRVQGNEIGTDASGLVPVPNAGAGVFVSNSASNNTIGAAAAATPTSGPAPGGNLIADNDGKGVVIGFGLADNAVGNAFVGNVIFANVGVANNLPFAAAFATVPVLIMILYLLAARRLGAFESL